MRLKLASWTRAGVWKKCILIGRVTCHLLRREHPVVVAVMDFEREMRITIGLGFMKGIPG